LAEKMECALKINNSNKVKFVSFIRVSFLAEKMECALKINNSNKV